MVRRMPWFRPPALLFALLLAGCGEPARDTPRPLSPAAQNRIDGQRFLAGNAQKPGITVLPSGVQYRVAVAGSGPKPTPADVVRVHYVGRFPDGTVFESSRDRGEAAVSIPVRMTIRGWQEVLPLMAVGSTWDVFIPSHLAYGLERAPANIGPNRTLWFTIELVAVAR